MTNQYDDIISDMYKDVHGSRPGIAWCRDFGEMSAEEQDLVVERFQKAISDDIKDEQELSYRLESQFEAEIARLIEAGAKDRTTAIKWYVDGLGLVEDDLKFYGASYICHTAGLPYSMGQVFVDAFGIQYG